MHKLTATDRLRELLDERGVEYETGDTPLDTHGTVYYCTSVKDPIVGKWIYEEPPDTDLIIACEYDVGAEDAIAATLGAGTCHMEYCDEWSGDELYPTEAYVCSACGYITEDGKPNYCPNCGRKVVDE